MAALIGRHQEINELHALYESNQAQLVAVSVRRIKTVAK